jgi:hypothetical protein
MKAMGVQIETL